MNKTKIDWCDMSWNPVTGCYNNCNYCYAHNIAHRFSGGLETDKEIIELQYQVSNIEDKLQPYPYGFKPTFHRYRLDEPVNKTKGKVIFVCSMADLFGSWVPDEWIEKIFEVVEKCPQHKFIFLTKNANRFMKLYENGLGCLLNLENAYFGITITDYREEPKIHYLSFISDKERRFVSAEPFLNCTIDNPFELKHTNKSIPGKIIIGAMTGNRILKPYNKALEALVNICRVKNISIFMKDNLKKYWDGEFIQEGF